MKIKKILVILFLILLSYSVYSADCNEVSDCDDDSYCTKDACDGNCSYTDVDGCIKDNFKLVGDSFTMGVGPCRNTYEYDDVRGDENKIILKKGSESISLTFDNSTSNYYGYPVSYDFKILNKTVTFYLRYNKTQNFIYLEDINKSCPVSDLCSTSEDCGDNNTCTIDECDGTPLTCTYHAIAYCKDNDGCCPSKCNMTEDNDCITDQCDSTIDCDDNDPCTNDLCNGTPKLCLNTAITACADDDGCCPSSCVYDTDKDCEKPVVCGDNVCEGNETKQNCCKDCSCDSGYECVENSCEKTKEAVAKETLEMNEDFKKEKEELVSKGFSLKESLLLKTEGGFNFNYVYKKEDKERIITGNMDEQNNVRSIKVKGGIPILWYTVILVLIFLITIIGLSLYRNIKLRKDEEKEERYARLLQQKMQKRPGPPTGPFYRR